MKINQTNNHSNTDKQCDPNTLMMTVNQLLNDTAINTFSNEYQTNTKNYSVLIKTQTLQIQKK